MSMGRHKCGHKPDIHKVTKRDFVTYHIGILKWPLFGDSNMNSTWLIFHSFVILHKMGHINITVYWLQIPFHDNDDDKSCILVTVL